MESTILACQTEMCFKSSCGKVELAVVDMAVLEVNTPRFTMFMFSGNEMFLLHFLPGASTFDIRTTYLFNILAHAFRSFYLFRTSVVSRTRSIPR